MLKGEECSLQPVSRGLSKEQKLLGNPESDSRHHSLPPPPVPGGERELEVNI